jgi:hypothetical protein
VIVYPFADVEIIETDVPSFTAAPARLAPYGNTMPGCAAVVVTVDDVAA